MPVPSSLTLNYDALLSHTLFNYQPKLADNIAKGNKVVNILKEEGRWDSVDGGERIQFNLMYGFNTTADVYSGYGQLDTTPQDGMTAAFFDWAQLAVSIAISGKEEAQNSGKAAILKLLDDKIMQAEISGQDLLNGCIVSGRITASANLGRFLAVQGRMDSGASGPLPLAALVDANPTRSAAIGNINPNTYSWWGNQATSSTATTFAGLKLEMRSVFNNCSKGTGGPPNWMVGDQIAWQTYWGALTTLERYVIDDAKVLDVLGGSDALKFGKAKFFWDEIVPDVETNATVAWGQQAAVGTVSASNIHFLNTQFMQFKYHKDRNWVTTPFIKPVGQDAKVAECLWMGALGVNNRRKHGVLYGISQSIVS